MGWFKKLANMARKSNNAATERSLGRYSGSLSYTNDDDYEEDEELVACVCSNCVHYTSTGNYCVHHYMDIESYEANTYGCADFLER